MDDDMDTMWDEDLFGRSDTDTRVAERADDEAAAIAAYRARSGREVPEAPADADLTPAEKRSSRVRGALSTLEPDLMTTSERVKREAEVEVKKTEPVLRPNGMLYHPRLLAGKVDLKVLDDCRKKGILMLLSGYPGCGKTSLVEAAFPDVITVAGHGEMEMSELVGRYVVRPGNNYVWTNGPLVPAMLEGKPLFVDDATLIPSGVLARLYPVMDGRNVINLDEHEGELITAAPGFYVIGAHNPGVPGAVLSEALASRFSLHIDVPTDFDVALKDLKIDRKAVALAKKLTAARDKGDNGWAPAMRELLAYQKIANLLGSDAAFRNMLSMCPELDRPTLQTHLGSLVDGGNPKPLDLGARVS